MKTDKNTTESAQKAKKVKMVEDKPVEKMVEVEAGGLSTEGAEATKSETAAPGETSGSESSKAAGDKPSASEPEVVELVLLMFLGYLPAGSVIKVPAAEVAKYVDSGKARRRN